MRNRYAFSLLLLALALGARLGHALHERRIQSETEDLLSVLPERPAAAPYVGQPVQFVDRGGVARPARISRVIDEKAGVVDLHVDLPSPDQPVGIERFVPPQERGAQFVYRWQPLPL